MKVLVSACLLGQRVRWNASHKKAETLESWALSNGIELIPVCPENELFGTPRPPIRLAHIENETKAVMKGRDVLSLLDEKCIEIQAAHPEAVGFIGISRSPTCGISVGVKNLGRTIKGSMHKTTSLPTVEYNQLKNENSRQQFLRRLHKSHEYICSRQESSTSG